MPEFLLSLPIFAIAYFVFRQARAVRQDRIELEEFLRQRGYLK